MSFVQGSITCIVAEVKDVVCSLTADTVAESQQTELSQRLMDMLQHIPTLNPDDPQQKFIVEELEGLSVSLWNAAVTKKTGRKLDALTNAKFRHAAYHLMLRCNENTNNEENIRKQMLMVLKTIQAWLDCEKASMCVDLLENAERCLDAIRTVESNATECPRSPDAKRQSTYHRDHFKLLCYQAEVAMALQQHSEAFEAVGRAKEKLSVLPKEGVFLSMLCYNFGVEDCRAKRFEESTRWLKESYDLRCGQEGISAKNQARTLRLLATIYLDWDSQQHWQKALSAISLANSEHSHPAGLCLKLRILLSGNQAEDIVAAALHETLRHSELTVDVGLSAVELLLNQDRRALGLQGLHELWERFQGSPEAGYLWGVQLELLLRQGLVTEARNKLQKGGKESNLQLTDNVRKRVHALIWERAAEKFQAKEFVEALEWYDLSEQLFQSDPQAECNQGKLHRNQTACHLELNKLDQALVSAEKAARLDPQSPHSRYLLYKVALLQGNTEPACSHLSEMCRCIREGDVGEARQSAIGAESHGFICLAAQLALEQSNRDVAMHALEQLASQSPSPQQVLTALRCLVRFKLTFITEGQNETSERPVILTYIRNAFETLSKCKESPSESIKMPEESVWFMKIAWNLALQCDDVCSELEELFLLCFKLSQLHPGEPGCLVRQKNCLLMAAAACLQMVRGDKHEDDRDRLLQSAIDHIHQCHSILKEIQDSRLSNGDQQQQKDLTTPVLLVLYEFEARSRLADGDLEAVLERTLQLPQVEPKAFETMATLALEGRRPQRPLAIRALKVAIKKYLHQPQVDYAKCSRAFHSLVEMALQSGRSGEVTSRDEAWGYYQDVLDIIHNRAQGSYPEMEVVWLMTKAWNCGVQMYSSKPDADALQWCDMGLQLMRHLSSLRENYETQMTTAFAEMQEKIGGRVG